MKKVLVVTILTLVAFGSYFTFAQEGSSPAQPQALSKEDKAKTQEELKKLAEAFGVEVAKERPAASTAAETAKDKTVADVADKALDMVKNTITSIASTLEKVAPQVWRIMIRQQYARALGLLIVPWGCVLLTLILIFVLHRTWPMTEEDKKESAFSYRSGDVFSAKGWFSLWRTGLPSTVCLLFAIWGVNRLSDSIMYLINPEYYAVRDLVIMLLGQGNAPQ
ncbi:MAG: hypothetical protein WC609_03645 [Candidatus Paceibacterota bacterium]|jgi:hypothetical protein